MYLSKIIIKNFRGLSNLSVRFDDKINIIIGENGCSKSALIDAIRILYNFSNQRKDIYVENKDFYIDKATEQIRGNIDLIYEFKELTKEQEGAFYEFLVTDKNPENTYARIHLTYEHRKHKPPHMEYFTGIVEGQKAEFKAFELFQHYYLDALRDSTKDLLNAKNNILGKLIMRSVEKKGNEEVYKKIIETANSELLKQEEVIKAKDDVNNNLSSIYKTGVINKVGLRLDDPKAEPFINSIKPFLPFDLVKIDSKGFELSQNSLGHNNLIYTATILGDASGRIEEDKNTHFALLIEEPEAHLHPQLQLNLYNFIKENIEENTQIFITSHSPTLTSKAKLNNLILLDKEAYKLDDFFNERDQENIIEDTILKTCLTEKDFQNRKQQLERYLDVTKSQLLFSNGVLFIEGISEELLLPAFFNLNGHDLQDFRIEMVNVGGTSFYPFLYLFNSTDRKKRLEKKIVILTDGDHFPASKNSEYSFSKLIENNYQKLDELFTNLFGAKTNTRIPNLDSVKNGISNIGIFDSFKTFEYEISIANTMLKQSDLDLNFFVKYIKSIEPKKYEEIKKYYSKFAEPLLEDQRIKTAILFWKTITEKSNFAQNFSLEIVNNIKEAKKHFIVPPYIIRAFDHLIK